MPTTPKPPIKSPVRTLAGGLLIDSTGRVVGRGSTPEDAAQIAEALNGIAAFVDALKPSRLPMREFDHTRPKEFPTTKDAAPNG